MTSYAVIGAGILGLATADALHRADPSASITLLEKESGPAQHQTGRNSGVIHSGIYYKPGSAKAVMCRAGATSMAAFAADHGIPVVHTGKLIVATQARELPGLDRLYQRGLDNGIPVTRIGPAEARDYEPNVAAIGAIRVESTAITDYRAVCRTLAAGLTDAGADVRYGTRVLSLTSSSSHSVLETSGAPVSADVVINCAGLFADRLAAADRRADDARLGADDALMSDQAGGDEAGGGRRQEQIVPFRGEYFELRPDRATLVNGLIYPVPDPDFPFLGVHLTKMIDGSVHAGPNAVLALAREGYDWKTVKPRDIAEVLRFPGFWRLARKNLPAGTAEVLRSLSRKRFAAALSRLVPEITVDDLVPSKAGVRAQALQRNGSLVDDFLIRRVGRNVHVLNAPSPAATSSLEIGRHIAELAVR